MGESGAYTGCMGCAQGWVGVLHLQQLWAVRVAVYAVFSLGPSYAGVEQWWHLWHLQLHLWQRERERATLRLATGAWVPGVWVEERGGGVADHWPASQCSGCCLGPLPAPVAQYWDSCCHRHPTGSVLICSGCPVVAAPEAEAKCRLCSEGATLARVQHV
jgi:hypothetical protein